MSTRLYLNEGTSGAFNIGAAVSSLWEQNIAGAFTTKKLGTATDSNANTNHLTGSLGNGSNPCDICYGQFLSDPMPSGVLISGTIRGNIVCREGNAADNLYTQLGLYVVDSSGVLVHTLLGGANSGGTEMNSPSANNREMPRNGATAITSYTTINATSRIVAEIGMRTESTRTTCQGYMYFGGGSGTDLPSGDGQQHHEEPVDRVQRGHLHAAGRWRSASPGGRGLRQLSRGPGPGRLEAPALRAVGASMGGLMEGLLVGLVLGFLLHEVILPAWVAARHPRHHGR